MAEKKAKTDKKYDFSGWATKYDVACTDGRTIQKDAFKHNDGMKIPLVWQHLHNDPNNILGHVVLEHRNEGVYAYGYLNSSDSGVQAGVLLEHNDLDSLSIYANKLVEKKNLVHQGSIREVSLVLSGANPGARIDYVSLSHADGSETESEDEAIIFSGEKLAHEETEEEVVEHADGEETVADVVESMNDNQKKVMYALIAQALADASGGEIQQSDDSQGETMKKNVFEGKEDEVEGVLTHSQLTELATNIFADLPKYGTFKKAFLAHVGTYGIGSDRANMELLFPDAKALNDEPSFETRQMPWVAQWMSSTRHAPFSRLKNLWADLTADAARAKGYITGTQKVEQVFPILKRETSPTTIYKKQKLDRDDIIDITDFDVVAWMWREMRFMLDEEVARAALVGDGRTFGVDDDAIDPTKIRPIFGDDPLFVHYLTLESTDTDWIDIMDAIAVARVNYKGTGTPNFYTTNEVLTGMLLVRDADNKRMFKSLAEVANELRVAEIIEVEVLENVTRTVDDVVDYDTDLLGIMVNPRDYTYGADKGGQIATFDDFDIDYNQYKYLIETRLSGSLLKPRTALVVERKQA